MIFGHIFGQVISFFTGITGGDFKNENPNIIASIVFLSSMGVFIYSFNKTINLGIASLFAHKTSKNHLAYISVLVMLIAYWIPLFTKSGFSDIDRQAWKLDNIEYGIHYTPLIFLALCISATIQERNNELRKVIISLIYIFVEIGIGERFTGLVLGAPIFLSIDKVRNSKRLIFTGLSLIIGLKLVSYYSIGIGSDLTSTITRLTKEPSMLNSVINNSEYFNWIDKPLALLPYQNFGEYDKTYIMNSLMDPGKFLSAKSNGGLVTGTFIEVISFLFHPVLAPLIALLLGFSLGRIIIMVIKLLTNSSIINTLFGIVLIILYQMRLAPIIHSGFFSGLFKIEFLYILGIIIPIYISKYFKKSNENKVA